MELILVPVSYDSLTTQEIVPPAGQSGSARNSGPRKGRSTNVTFRLSFWSALYKFVYSRYQKTLDEEINFTNKYIRDLKKKVHS